jgi:hypothetical protein
MTIPDTPRNIFRYWHHLLLLSLESHCVIAMRTIKLAGGGFSALDEASRIMVEKVAATTDIPRALYTRSPVMLTVTYRKLVRSNLRRLAMRRSSKIG